MSWDETVKTEPKKDFSGVKLTNSEEDNILFSDLVIEKWAINEDEEYSKICCMVYGSDGTGKSGLVFDYLTDEDVKQGKQMWIIDLDGGAMPLKRKYHKSKGNNLVVIDPLVTKETKEGTMIDYRTTFAKIRAIIRYVKKNHKQKKIKAIAFDGLSTALSYAEQQMRVDKNLDEAGGVQLIYWLKRNKLFLETLEQIKSIPIARFFVAHENFIMTKDASSVIAKTNAMMIQKLRCKRDATPVSTKFSTTIDKNKYNVIHEGLKIEFCKVDKTKKEYNWDTKEIFGSLV